MQSIIDVDMKKPTWAYVVTIISAVCFLPMGPGMIMIPFLPVMLAAFSTDSGDVADYIPVTIFLGGYAILITWAIILTMAIKKIIAFRKLKKAALMENKPESQAQSSQQVESIVIQKKPLWVWIVLGFTLIALIRSGIYAFVFPFMYAREVIQSFSVIGLLFSVLAFVFLIGWIFLIVRAIKLLLQKR